MEDESKSQQRVEKAWRERIGSMVHVISIPLVLFIVWLAQPGSSLFSWHPTLMILGFGFFMLEAILIFSRSSSLIPSSPRATKVKYHWILQTLATICATGGFLAIFINKNNNNKLHFKSWHGFLGGIAVLLSGFQSVAGIMLLYPNLPLVNTVKLALKKKLHAVSGSLIFVLSCLIVFLGFYSNWFVSKVGLYSWGWGLCAVCPVFLAATVNNQVAQVYVFRKP